MGSDMEELIGYVVEEILISEDNVFLVFKVRANRREGKFLVYEAEGDCCSSSWFNDLIGVENLIERKVISVESVESVELPEPDSREEYECLQDYGYKITTSKGYCDLVFRNSSNGYYGGWLQLVENPEWNPYRSYYRITADWSADD